MKETKDKLSEDKITIAEKPEAKVEMPKDYSKELAELTELRAFKAGLEAAEKQARH